MKTGIQEGYSVAIHANGAFLDVFWNYEISYELRQLIGSISSNKHLDLRTSSYSSILQKILVDRTLLLKYEPYPLYGDSILVCY